jgi:hypothetical protein
MNRQGTGYFFLDNVVRMDTCHHTFVKSQLENVRTHTHTHTHTHTRDPIPVEKS